MHRSVSSNRSSTFRPLISTSITISAIDPALNAIPAVTASRNAVPASLNEIPDCGGVVLGRVVAVEVRQPHHRSIPAAVDPGTKRIVHGKDDCGEEVFALQPRRFEPDLVTRLRELARPRNARHSAFAEPDDAISDLHFAASTERRFLPAAQRFAVEHGHPLCGGLGPQSTRHDAQKASESRKDRHRLYYAGLRIGCAYRGAAPRPKQIMPLLLAKDRTCVRRGDRYSIRLRYWTNARGIGNWMENAGACGAPGETRTPDLLVRSQSLYPAELRARAIMIPFGGESGFRQVLRRLWPAHSFHCETRRAGRDPRATGSARSARIG